MFFFFWCESLNSFKKQVVMKLIEKRKKKLQLPNVYDIKKLDTNIPA